jgi:hypothetical protein
VGPAGQYTLKRRLGRSVHASHATAGACLGAQLHRRLEKVHVQAHCPVQFVQLALGAFPFETVVADQLAYDRAIFLFDLSELGDYADSRCLTGLREMAVDESSRFQSA